MWKELKIEIKFRFHALSTEDVKIIKELGVCELLKVKSIGSKTCVY